MLLFYQELGREIPEHYKQIKNNEKNRIKKEVLSGR